jgi:hypothetical protein
VLFSGSNEEEVQLKPLVVETAQDWEWLRSRKLMTIVDPMVFRTADLFLGGRSWYGNDERSAEAVWATIDKNILALSLFFDAIILREQLPIFSYTATFREGRLLELGREGDFLVQVVVGGEVYQKSKDSALKELEDSPPILASLADDILAELDTFGYAWYPDFPIQHADDKKRELSSKERQLRAFLLGGLIFGGYAQQLSRPRGGAERQAEHLIQPKRSRLLLAASIGDMGKTTTDEMILLRRFKRLAGRVSPDTLHPVELPKAPTFLPLLLRQKPSTPHDLLKLALEWRNKRSVRAFRDWYRNIEIELHRNYVPPELDKELKQLQRDLAQEIGRAPEKTLTLSTEVGAELNIGKDPQAGLKATISAQREVELSRVKWFFQSLLPHHSYRKLFVRMAAAQSGYSRLTQMTHHLGELWTSDAT